MRQDRAHLDGWPALNVRGILAVRYAGLFGMGLTFALWSAAMAPALLDDLL